MPTYCYRKGKKVVQRVFSSEERPDFIIVGGQKFRRSREDEWAAQSIPVSAGWPLECVASGVAPSQADELRKFYRDHGCPTEVTKDGNPVYRNAAHRRKALKCRGFKDRSSFF